MHLKTKLIFHKFLKSRLPHDSKLSKLCCNKKDENIGKNMGRYIAQY
jgi:hypothetical protein